MKKKLFAILILSLVFILTLIGCTPNYTKMQISTGEDGGLDTLMLSDIRFDGSSTDNVRRNMIKNMIADKKPEFIAINGNTVNCNNNGEVMRQAAEFFDSFDIPWAVSLGELDINGSTSKKGLIKILTDKSLKNSLVMRGENYEYNYILEIVDTKNKVKNILYFLDTSVRCSDQLVEWYQNTAKNLSYKYLDRQGEMLNSHIFINKPLSGFAKSPNNTGSSAYQVTPWENSDNLQKAVGALKSTRAVFAGFDNMANGAEFKYQENLQYAYIRTMLFDSSMTGDTYLAQKKVVGCSFYQFRDTKYVDIDATYYSPDSYKS